jgi:hypothetical protein
MDRNHQRIEDPMTKRPAETIAEEGKEFNHAASAARHNLKGQDFAFLDDVDALLMRLAALPELLRVVDLTKAGDEEREPVSAALREFGGVLSGLACEAADKLMRGRDALDLR